MPFIVCRTIFAGLHFGILYLKHFLTTLLRYILGSIYEGVNRRLRQTLIQKLLFHADCVGGKCRIELGLISPVQFQGIHLTHSTSIIQTLRA